jgi:transposase
MRKQFSAAFKAQVVHELLKEEKSVAQLAAEYGVHPTQLGTWKALALHGLPSLFEERSEVGALKTAHEAQLTVLYAEIGRLTTQVAWLKKTWPATGIEPSVSRWWSAASTLCR